MDAAEKWMGKHTREHAIKMCVFYPLKNKGGGKVFDCKTPSHSTSGKCKYEMRIVAEVREDRVVAFVIGERHQHTGVDATAQPVPGTSATPDPRPDNPRPSKRQKTVDGACAVFGIEKELRDHVDILATAKLGGQQILDRLRHKYAGDPFLMTNMPSARQVANRCGYVRKREMEELLTIFDDLAWTTKPLTELLTTHPARCLHWVVLRMVKRTTTDGSDMRESVLGCIGPHTVGATCQWTITYVDGVTIKYDVDELVTIIRDAEKNGLDIFSEDISRAVRGVNGEALIDSHADSASATASDDASDSHADSASATASGDASE